MVSRPYQPELVTLRERLASINLEMFSNHSYDTIVTACASCHSGLGQIYPEWLMVKGIPEEDP